ncbi:MAG TPA: type II toxin-antitoxin system HicA family toxin [Terriglobia bacterium]|nr:type II toxin-antitoxin system HicA family toxin [Terriglobia bacterium]
MCHRPPTRRRRQSDGFELRRQKGSHRHYIHPDGRRVTLSFHYSSDTFRPGTLQSMIELQARWTEEGACVVPPRSFNRAFGLEAEVPDPTFGARTQTKPTAAEGGPPAESADGSTGLAPVFVR